jgi:putative ABC transport system substrate-binding protein
LHGPDPVAAPSYSPRSADGLREDPMMDRRMFLAGTGAVLLTAPLAAEAQQVGKVWRIGVLMPESERNPESKARVAAFERRLQELGWNLGRNLQIDYRWNIGDIEKARAATADLLKSMPDALIPVASPATAAMQQMTRTIPIVFVAVSEPIGRGFVTNLAHPGGNMTGFTHLEPTLGSKWLELLKEIAPRVSRVALMFNAAAAQAAALFLGSVEAAAQRFKLTAVAAQVHGLEEVEAVIARLAGEPVTGLIFPPDPFTVEHHKAICELANRHRMPTVAGFGLFPADGGLVSYGVFVPDLFRQAADYIDRILKGEQPGNLPVQQPTKFEMVINLKTAKALGLIIPQSLLLRADEVIQ